MEPLYKTTVSKLIEHAENRLYALNDEFIKCRDRKRNGDMSFSEYCSIIGENTPIERQYRDNLAYLSGCDPDERVSLTYYEWEIYFKGKQR